MEINKHSIFFYLWFCTLDSCLTNYKIELNNLLSFFIHMFKQRRSFRHRQFFQKLFLIVNINSNKEQFLNSIGNFLIEIFCFQFTIILNRLIKFSDLFSSTLYISDTFISLLLSQSDSFIIFPLFVFCLH